VAYSFAPRIPITKRARLLARRAPTYLSLYTQDADGSFRRSPPPPKITGFEGLDEAIVDWLTRKNGYPRIRGQAYAVAIPATEFLI